jgi:AcrR family transcriptional regulator
MARPKSEDKRNAIMRAATAVVAAQGLGAPTALIAREAGVSNGSLFTYFETKADLFNQLYLELKTEMTLAALADVPINAASREQMFRVWSNWMRWAMAHPEKRAVLAQLAVSEELTPATRDAGHNCMAGLAGLLARLHVRGPMRDAPLEFALAIMNGVAEATIDFMMQNPGNADTHCQAGFDAVWRVLK